MSNIPPAFDRAEARTPCRRFAWIWLIPLAVAAALGYAGWPCRCPLNAMDLIVTPATAAFDTLLIWDLAMTGPDDPAWGRAR